MAMIIMKPFNTCFQRVAVAVLTAYAITASVTAGQQIHVTGAIVNGTCQEELVTGNPLVLQVDCGLAPRRTISLSKQTTQRTNLSTLTVETTGTNKIQVNTEYH